MDLNCVKIGFGISASFCTVLDIIKPMRELIEAGARVYPVLSNNVYTKGSRFHSRSKYLKEIEEITGEEIINTIAQAELFGPDNPMDVMLIAPATGNTMAKLANGITDNALIMAAKATLRNQKPVVLAPFTNDALSTSGINIMRLYNSKNIYFVPFGQDAPHKKPNSMTADLSKIKDTVIEALKGKQIQPSIITF